MAATDTPTRIAALAAKVQTVGGARAVLGKVSEILREGYEKLPEISTIAGLREESQRQLDIANAYAQGLYTIYAGATPDLYDQEISFKNAAKIGLALETAREVLRNLEDAANVEWWDIVSVLEAALMAAQRAIEWTAQTAAKAVAGAGAPLLKAFWPYLLIAGVGLFLWWKFGRKLIAKAGGAA